ncbi:MAG: cytidine deaminase [Candidatus Improbicoccus pseudotrichonymphae]|uniref:Cytidine deaminase n=1 Tax=Candidatus Improbicoccus pseudotrichonymphae TaxID=3033792 RepID=A0AA48I475_9FIRM|nr:MAG: cytidine deaminase [Candidatus Improbicoccus pseudotrichonymphae]
MLRRDKDNYYLDVAQIILSRASCLRRKFGAVIVNKDKIISCGYNGAPRGRQNCCDLNFCVRNKLNVSRGQKYELCRSVHAEANAIIHSSLENMMGSCLYLVGIEVKDSTYVENAVPCDMCKRLIINSGIEKVFARNTVDDFSVMNVSSWIEEDNGVEGLNIG